jgi:hypothetical protein
MSYYEGLSGFYDRDVIVENHHFYANPNQPISQSPFHTFPQKSNHTTQTTLPSDVESSIKYSSQSKGADKNFLSSCLLGSLKVYQFLSEPSHEATLGNLRVFGTPQLDLSDDNLGVCHV